MQKELFIETENKIRRYYQKEKIIDSLNKRLKILEDQITVIENDLKTCNVTIEPSIKAISYEERVQTSGDGTSYAEREVMKVTEFKIKRMAEKKLEREKILDQIDKIELDYAYIHDAIEPLKGVYKELLKMKYEKRMGEQQIANTMNWSQPVINRRKAKLLELIANWDLWNKTS